MIVRKIKQKSYTYLEYEYTINKNIFIFVVILNEQFPISKALILSDGVYEKGNITLYNDFKKLVMFKIVHMVSDAKDIKLAIHLTLVNFLE